MDQKQYGKITSNSTAQYALNSDQYPKNVDSAITVINTRKRELEMTKHLKDKKERNKTNNKGKKTENNSNKQGYKGRIKLCTTEQPILLRVWRSGASEQRMSKEGFHAKR